ncbi:hypothetical protein VPH35_082902 [Triticum aestivum]
MPPIYTTATRRRMTGRVGRRGKPSMAILVALLMALVALPLLMVPDTLSMPGSNGVDRGAALSLPRPCFSRSVFELRLENIREKRESWMETCPTWPSEIEASRR